MKGCSWSALRRSRRTHGHPSVRFVFKAQARDVCMYLVGWVTDSRSYFAFHSTCARVHCSCLPALHLSQTCQTPSASPRRCGQTEREGGWRQRQREGKTDRQTLTHTHTHTLSLSLSLSLCMARAQDIHELQRHYVSSEQLKQEEFAWVPHALKHSDSKHRSVSCVSVSGVQSTP